MTEYDKIQKELQHYKEIFGVDDVATKGYRVIVKQLKQQIEFLNDFDLKVKIKEGDKEYERAQKIFNEMPSVIMSLKDLKDKLGIEYVEKVERMQATSPQSIGLLKTGS